MNKNAASLLFVIVGLIWIIVALMRSEQRTTFLALGVVFFLLGLAVRAKNQRKSD